MHVKGVQVKALSVKRPLPTALLAGTLAISFVAAIALEADARHRRPIRRYSIAAFEGGFSPPDQFACRWADNQVHGYSCTGTNPTVTFLLKDALARSGNPPEGEGFQNLAAPDSFSCEFDGSTTKDTAHYLCVYRHTHEGEKGEHVQRFRLADATSVTDLDPPDQADDEANDLDIWLLPHDDQTLKKVKVPLEVPAGVA
jgi:hypothetical protein